MVRIDSECKVDLVKYQSEDFVLTTQATGLDCLIIDD